MGLRGQSDRNHVVHRCDYKLLIYFMLLATNTSYCAVTQPHATITSQCNEWIPPQTSLHTEKWGPPGHTPFFLPSFKSIGNGNSPDPLQWCSSNEHSGVINKQRCLLIFGEIRECSVSDIPASTMQCQAISVSVTLKSGLFPKTSTSIWIHTGKPLFQGHLWDRPNEFFKDTLNSLKYVLRLQNTACIKDKGKCNWILPNML